MDQVKWFERNFDFNITENIFPSILERLEGTPLYGLKKSVLLYLIDFVPSDKYNAELPCHSIPLNAAGDTVESLERSGNQAKLESVLKEWMRAEIKALEAARSH